MSGLFDGLDRLDVDGHARRWSAPDVMRTDGAVSEWIGAAQLFAARVQQDPAKLTGEQWRAIAEAWPLLLLAAAERATGAQHDEWLLRDLWLRASLLKELKEAGAAPDVPLLDPGPVLDRALDAMPMAPDTAAALAPRWRELDREQVLSLRMVRRLLGPARAVAPLLGDHPRRGEFEAWDRIADGLP
ncbi:hypothetical protein ACFY6U_46345 [Streptomyces sp. NPDC013157]|uniref:hypothetical protein n=1 Tax=Streptomyces sp. NPDC013157 TaxID=3364861 RepID=UPI003681B71F